MALTRLNLLVLSKSIVIRQAKHNSSQSVIHKLDNGTAQIKLSPTNDSTHDGKTIGCHDYQPYAKILGQEPRFNPLGIEMLPERLYKQVFGDRWGEEKLCDISDYKGGRLPTDSVIPDTKNLKKCIQHLHQHDLLPKQLDTIDTIYEYHKHLSKLDLGSDKSKSHNRKNSSNDIVLNIPNLEGKDIDEHFINLGRRYSQNYNRLASMLTSDCENIIKNMPQEWNQVPGWTRYAPTVNGFEVTVVEAPLEPNLVFDVETCMNDKLKHAPTLAVAVSDKAWYSWTSPRLLSPTHEDDTSKITINDLIPFNSSDTTEKLIVGHNVGFDRSFLQDQYVLKETKTKFLDTLSLHMCICGLTRMQRNVKLAQKRKLKENETLDQEDIEQNAWIEKSSLNNLADVYQFHCGRTISKDDREIFVKGTMNDVIDNYQTLMTYCANDVKATFEIFKILYPTFNERFPHPVTMAGMLEMSTMYLPVHTRNWLRYIEESQKTYDEYEKELSNSLQELAIEACSKSSDDYAKDVWLWDLDWSKQSIMPNKTKMNAWQKLKDKAESSGIEKSINDQVQEIYDTKNFMRSIVPFMPGFPKWYRDVCCPPNKAADLLDGREWQPGPCLITTQQRITPKLMQLTWNGYPLHHHPTHGWGYLIPNDDLVAEFFKLPEGHPYENFPIDQLRLLCKDLPRSHILVEDGNDETSILEDDFVQQQIEELKDNTEMATMNLIKLLRKISKKKKVAPRFKNEFCDDVEIPGAYFIRLPHKNGPNSNVGNPLSKDFVAKVEDGTLSSFDNELAMLLLQHSSSLSYWKNSHKRIKNQMIVELDDSVSVILPRVIVAGTVTRRAVEPTWLTASNQDTSRIGSELKAMVQAPPGYCFVGADVDSQELWIASLMGDSYSYQIHGGTGLSYMTLRGSKSDKTDMHSKTASLIGISRSDAKVLNYARIYGAGQKFIERFLIKTNHQLTPEEAKEKAKTIFKETKGMRRYYWKSSQAAYINQHQDNSPLVRSNDKSISIPIDIQTDSSSQDVDLAPVPTNLEQQQAHVDQQSSKKKDIAVFWDGGTESATFNKLEEIASSSEPRTPVLNCQISQALEPDQDHARDFVTSRVNWVVQSSAVDFLHLVLVNMRWLFEKLKIDGRFSISIHDEVRYMVKEEDRYKAAYALQVSNLLVRSYFAYKLNMKDLPISVAFFSSVDIDNCLRKDVDMDCKSPSNPLGLSASYGIKPGESLDVEQILKKFSLKEGV